MIWYDFEFESLWCMVNVYLYTIYSSFFIYTSSSSTICFYDLLFHCVLLYFSIDSFCCYCRSPAFFLAVLNTSWIALGRFICHGVYSCSGIMPIWAATFVFYGFAIRQLSYWFTETMAQMLLHKRCLAANRVNVRSRTEMREVKPRFVRLFCSGVSVIILFILRKSGERYIAVRIANHDHVRDSPWLDRRWTACRSIHNLRRKIVN